MKIASAFIGQGHGADFMLDKIQQYWDDRRSLWLMFVHDEAILEVPTSFTLDNIRDMTSILRKESRILPGFSCPFKVKAGENWGEMSEVEL